MQGIESVLRKKLDQKANDNRLRALSFPRGIDFSSNDYLGLARSSSLAKTIQQEIQYFPNPNNGSGGSRLLNGNSEYAVNLEKELASFHHAESGLLFNSGYDANIGLFSCIADRHDIILYDEYIHASIIDGIRLSFAKSYKFLHNDIAALESKLQTYSGVNIFIAVESVYSMDGDFAPLTELVALCEKYGANLIVDEAHATGIFGKKGLGYLTELGLEQKCFARIHTFGKAVGVHGAIVLGSQTLTQYLINTCRSFMYTTSLPFHSLAAIRCAYTKMQDSDGERQYLSKLITYFKQQLSVHPNLSVLNSHSPIQGIIIPGNATVKAAAVKLQTNGLDIRPILSPTVPEGKERLRICLHAFNTEKEIDHLFSILTHD